MTRHHNHGHGQQAIALPLLQERDAINIGHPYIEQNEVGRARESQVARLISVFGRGYDVTLVTQYFREQFPDTHFIINYQNVRHCRLFFSIRWTRTEIVFFAINNVK